MLCCRQETDPVTLSFEINGLFLFSGQCVKYSDNRQGSWLAAQPSGHPRPQLPHLQRLLERSRCGMGLIGPTAPAGEQVGAHRADDGAAGALRHHQALDVERGALGGKPKANGVAKRTGATAGREGGRGHAARSA